MLSAFCSTQIILTDLKKNSTQFDSSSLLVIMHAGSSCIAVQWGAWSSTGMATAQVLARLERIGQGALTPTTGLSALAAALSGSASFSFPMVTQLTVNPFAWDR